MIDDLILVVLSFKNLILLVKTIIDDYIRILNLTITIRNSFSSCYGNYFSIETKEWMVSFLVFETYCGTVLEG